MEVVDTLYFRSKRIPTTTEYLYVNRHYILCKVGKKTVCGIVYRKNQDELYIQIGLTECSLKDNFCKLTGRINSEYKAERKPVTSISTTKETYIKDFREIAKTLVEKEKIKLFLK